MPPGHVRTLHGRSFRPVRLRSSNLQLYDPGDHKGRISIEPYFAVGIFSAQRIASSRSLQSTRKYPPSCSCVSANGPSVIMVLSFRTRTVVALVSGATPLLEISTSDADISRLNSAQVFAAACNSSFDQSEPIDSSAYINNKYFMSLISYGKR